MLTRVPTLYIVRDYQKENPVGSKNDTSEQAQNKQGQTKEKDLSNLLQLPLVPTTNNNTDDTIIGTINGMTNW